MSAEAQPFVSKATSFTDAHTRLRRRALLLARVSWFADVGLTVALFVASIPIQIAESQIICNDPVVNNCFNLGQLTPQSSQELQQIADLTARAIAIHESPNGVRP